MAALEELRGLKRVWVLTFESMFSLQQLCAFSVIYLLLHLLFVSRSDEALSLTSAVTEWGLYVTFVSCPFIAVKE